MTENAMIKVHPRWLVPYRPGTTDRLFYDGMCGLCHNAVKLSLKYDFSGSAFRYAPLQSEVLDRELPPSMFREDLPDSIVIITSRQEVLIKSDAALYLGKRLGGIWRVLATLAEGIPRVVRDAVYDGVARIRHRVFAKPQDACPMLPPHLRARFDFD